jgi:hypothetical protein
MSDLGPESAGETSTADDTSVATTSPPDSGSSIRDGSVPPPTDSSSDQSIPVFMTREKRRPMKRQWLSNRRTRAITVVAVVTTAIGLSVGLATSGSTSPNVSGGNTSSFGARGSNARSGPAAGGVAGTISAISKTSFTVTTSVGQSATINENPSTKYLNGTKYISVNTLTKGERVLVLGTTSNTSISATQVIVERDGSSMFVTSSNVIPFVRGASTNLKQNGQIPADWTQGSGTIVSGTTANDATEAALAAYPGGIVDRVVKLSSGEYNVHYIGVNWPHHVFVNQAFKVVGAE